MRERFVLLDPTAEQQPARRPRRAPPDSLAGQTVALLDIGKARGDVFIEQLGLRLSEQGIEIKRYTKPTNTKVAPAEVSQSIATECDLVVEALSD